MISNIKLSNLLTVLTKDELIEFEHFINSPFYNRSGQSGNLTALFHFLLKAVQESKVISAPFDRRQAFAVTFPETAYVDGKLEKSLSVLHHLLKQYISVRQRALEDNTFEDFLHQLAFYRERGLKNRYENLRDQIWDLPEITGVMNWNTLRRRFAIKYEVTVYEVAQNSKKIAELIPKTMENLEASFLFNKLELINQYLLFQRISRFDLSDEVKELIAQEYFSEKIIEKQPILLLSYRTFRLLEQGNPSVAAFYELQDLFEFLKNEVDAEYTRVFLTYLRNFCAILVLDGQSGLLPVLFRLSNEHYRLGYLYQISNKIHVTALISVSNTALLVNELKWAEEFIAVHENRILGDTDDVSYFRLAQANLLFYKKKYEDAVSKIPDSLSIVDAYLFARRLELKCWYELQSPLLDSKIDAFRMYISRAGRDTLPALSKKRNANFINLLARIHTTAPGSTKRIAKLLEEARNETQIVEKEWLISVLSRRK